MCKYRYPEKRCRYADCPEHHPVIAEEEEETVRVTCETCRRYMGLPSLDEDCRQNHHQPCTE